MKKIVIIFVSAIFAVFAVMSMAYSRDNIVVVVLEPASITGNHSSEPVPGKPFRGSPVTNQFPASGKSGSPSSGMTGK